MRYEEFIKDVKRVTYPRTHKIKNSIGVYDAYKYYRKNKPKESKFVLTESQYFTIIRTFNNLLAENISLGIDVKLPYMLGTIELRKFKPTIYIDPNTDKLKINLPINWTETHKLWFEDEESHKEKKLIFLEEDAIYKIKYNKYKAKYKNKKFYNFNINRNIKIKLKHNIKNNLIDAFLI